MKTVFIIMALMFATQAFTVEIASPVVKPATTASLIEKIQLTEYNSISLIGPISQETASNFSRDLFSKDFKNSDEIYLFIDSPGGDIQAGAIIIDAMKASGKKISCISRYAASMAFVITQYCDKRFVTSDGLLMQHVPTYSLSGQAPNFKSILDLLERLVASLDEHQAARIGISYLEFKALTRPDWWLIGAESVEANVADAVVYTSCSSSLVKKSVEVIKRGLFGPIKFKMSACPLLRAPLPASSKTAKGIKAINLISNP